MQTRHIATVFPGRMTGSPAEMLSADYLRQQFEQMGYRSDIRTFNSRYIYTAKNNRKNWHNVTGSTVIAAHEGKAPQQIIIMAHPTPTRRKVTPTPTRILAGSLCKGWMITPLVWALCSNWQNA